MTVIEAVKGVRSTEKTRQAVYAKYCPFDFNLKTSTEYCTCEDNCCEVCWNQPYDEGMRTNFKWNGD